MLGADEQGSPHHDVLRDADDISGMPVVVADLHSALPAVLAGVFSATERSGVIHSPADGVPRVVYVMQDGGALPAWFSRTCATLREAGRLAATVTTGQSFGGDLETVTVHTGLLAARHVLGADIAVVAQGPGNLGTGTRWGFSGVAAGEAVNAVAALGGRPVASLRVSDADPRERHHGVSHHSLTAYGRVALARAQVVVPALGGEFGDLVAAKPPGWARGTRSSPCPSTASSRRCGRARRGCRRWAAEWTRTSRTSSPQRRPDCRPPAAGQPLRASMMSTTNTRVSVPLMPAADWPALP